jgi:amino acid adenylation domain-containing protein
MLELPLSAAQERFWFLDRFDPGQPNNVTLSRRLAGPLDADLLGDALSAVVSRHEALRATFTERDGRPIQTITDPYPFALEQHDLRGDAAAAAAGAAAGAAAEQRARDIGQRVFETRFDLAKGPLLRVVLVCLADQDHVLFVVAHHIVCDGSSLSILLRDLHAVYAARLEGRVHEWAPMPFTWADYVREQAGTPPEKVEQCLAYWRERLAGVGALTLATDLPRPMFKTPRTERVQHDLDRSLAARLERFAKDQRCTLFMVLLAAYQVLLGRHAGQDDVSVGVASAGRDRAALEPLVGLFVNTLVLRGDLSGDPSLRQLLARTRAMALDAYAHQEIPFERLVGELDVARDVSRTPLFETMFTLHLYERADMALLPGVTGTAFGVGAAQSLFDIVCDAWVKADGGIGLIARYDSALFTPETMQNLLRRYEILLHSALEDPDQPIWGLRLDDAAASRAVVALGQGPRRHYSGTVLDLMAPHTGLAAGDYSYAELTARSVQIARYLWEQKRVRPRDIVAVRMDRTPDLVATLLAVWRCGAAYLPIDPGLPGARISWLQQDAGAKTLVTQADVEPAGQWESDVELPGCGPHDLAYVLYTSGSTGTPKGVAVPHGALTNLLLSLRDTLDCGPGDVWLGLTSLSFDISGLELYLPMVTGARLVLVPDEATKDGVRVAEIINGNGVTHVQATPAGWRLLLDSGFGNPAVTALTGGEALPPRLARQLRPRVKRLCNVYGPTETTIWSTLNPHGDSTLGGPLGNTQLYVVDSWLRPVPAGVPGELAIGGAGVAWGYLGRSGLTADRFVPDPFGPPGSRLYRTGDRVRWSSGGKLEFLGRVDNQIKIRGYRIEPGEIEARLTEHPQVGQAAVIVAGEGHDARLLAYVTPAADQAPPAGRDLRGYLTAQLPSYLVPAQVAVLDALPLTASGKIDRKRLPEIEADVQTEYLAPRTDLERAIGTIWSEVLGRDPVGALDDFFDLGGHSLLATKVISRLTAALGVEVPIRLLFVHPVMAEFAASVEAQLVSEVQRLSGEEVAALLAQEGTA